jgi:hypothetical protein
MARVQDSLPRCFAEACIEMKGYGVCKKWRMAACLYLFSSQYFITQPLNDVARQIWRTRGLIVPAPSRDGKSFVSYSLISCAFLHFCVSGELFPGLLIPRTLTLRALCNIPSTSGTIHHHPLTLQ